MKRLLVWIVAIAASWGLLAAVVAVTAHGADWLRSAMGLEDVSLVGLLLGVAGVVVIVLALWLGLQNDRRRRR